MIVGLVTLFAVLFGSGAAEVFFIDEIEKGVKKYVVDKERKAAVLEILGDGKKRIKEFHKDASSRAKVLKKNNYDRFLEGEYYKTFFKDRLKDYEVLQDYISDIRVEGQGLITDEEWAGIMQFSSSNQMKDEEKAAKEELKKKSKSIYTKLEAAVNEIKNKDSRNNIIEALTKYESEHDAYLDKLESLNVNDSKIVASRTASKDELLDFGKKINNLRAEMIEIYLELFFVIRENASVDTYDKIIKELNKLIL